MASAFNLTAQINLQGPVNLKATAAKIKKELGSIKATVDLDVKATSAKNIASINSKLKELSKFANNANTSVRDLNSSLTALANSFTKLSNAGSASVSGIDSTNKALSSTKKGLTDVTTEIEEFGKQSGLAIRRFAAFSVVTSVVYGVVNAFSSAFKEFVNFNQEIVRLSQVTGKSTADLGAITDEITRLSTGLGVASSDLLVVSTTLAQAGLSAEDTRIALEALAKSSLAPSFDNLTDTTEGAIAVLRQFGLQASDLEGALGAINEVSAQFAVEASDLITAIQRTGGVFASSSKGISEGKDALNEFLAVFTSVRQTTRESAETIATGLRTIFSRIQRGDTIKALKEFGIELTDLEGKFVGPYEAVRRLSDGLNKLDPRSLDFARITEELGGFRQIGKVIPLIQQFAVAQEALKVAQRGQDSLAKDAAIAQESLANRFTKTRESFIALVRDFGNSNTFNALAETTLTLANSLITVTKALEPLLPLLVAFAGIKIGSGLTQFASGFGKGFGGGGNRGGGTSPTPTSPGPSSPSGTPKNDALLANNTTALSSLLGPINSLLQSINTVNSTLNQTNVLLKVRPSGGIKGFARGGLVPGSGNRDTIPAMLTPGEFVIRKKAVQALGLDRLMGMNRYASGGKIKKNYLFDMLNPQKFAGGGIARILRQNVIAAAILRDSNYSREQLDNSKRKILKSVGSYLNDDEKAILSNYDLVREGVNPDLRANFTTSIRRGLVAGVESAVLSATKDIGLPTIKISRNRDNFSNFFKSINDASLGNLFEDVLSTVEKLGVFPTAENPRRPFDFTTGLQSALAQRLFPNISSSSIQYVDAKASSKAAGPKGMLDKIIEQIKLEHPNGPITNTVVSAASPSNARDAVLQRLRTSPSTFFSTSDLQNDKNTRQFRSQINKTLLEDMFREGLISKQSNRYVFKRSGFAKGGSISSKDTVPALLTPGEFVINKRAAQRIGYNNLRKLNYADRVRGYNKGGVVGTQKLNTGGAVQRFAIGGEAVGATDLFAIGAIFTSILQPQIEKLANSFVDADGKINKFASGLAGAIREISSLSASAAIGLSAVGASRKDKAIGITTGVIGGALGGSLTSAGSAGLQEALDSNSKALTQFNNFIQQFEQANDPEAQAKASAQVQKSYAELSKTFEDNKKAINLFETMKNFGDSVTSAASSALIIQTSLIALNGAIYQSTVAMNANTQAQTAAAAAASANSAVSAIKGFKDLRGVINAFSAVGINLLKFRRAIVNTIGFLGKWAGWIGLAISSIQLLYGAYKYLTGGTKKASEETLKWAESLTKATKANNDYSLNNERYTKVLLQRYQQLRSQGTSDTELRRILGSVGAGPGISGRQVEVQLDNGDKFVATLNDMSATLRTFIAGQAANIDNGGLVLNANEDINKSLEELKKVFPDRVAKLESKLSSILLEYLKQQYALMRKEQGGPTDQATIDREFTAIVNSGSAALSDLVGKIGQFTGASEVAAYASNLAAQASLAVSQRFIRLADISANFESGLSALISTLEYNNKTLQDRISLFEEQPKVTGTANDLRLNAQIINNLKGFQPEEISRAISSSLSLINPARVGQPVSKENMELIRSFENEILALRTLEEALSAFTKDISGAGDAKGFERLREGITIALKDNANLSDTRVAELAASVENILKEAMGKEGKTLSPEQIMSKLTDLGMSADSAKAAQKILAIASEETAKVFDMVNENATQYGRTLAQLRDLQSRSLQARFENLSELGRILGQEIKKSDISKAFDAQIKALTGVTTVDQIIAIQTKKRQRLDEIRNKTAAERLADPALTKEAGKLSGEIQSTNQALQLIISSGTKLKASFDALAEREKKLFSGPKNVLLDLFKNPAKIRDLLIARRDAGLIMNGRDVTPQQIANVTDILIPVLEALGRQNEAKAITDRLILNKLGEAGQQAFATQDTQGINAVISVGSRVLTDAISSIFPSIKELFIGKEAADVRKNINDISKAYESLGANTKAIADYLASEGIINPLTTFNNELPKIIERRILAENDLIDVIETQALLRQQSMNANRPDSSIVSMMETFGKGMDPLLKKIESLSRITQQITPSDYRMAGGYSKPEKTTIPPKINIENIDELRSITSRTSPSVALDIINEAIISANAQQLAEKDSTVKTSINEFVRELIKLKSELLIINETYKEQNRIIPDIPVRPRIQRSNDLNPQQNSQQPQMIQTGALQKTFDNFTTNFGVALQTAGETFGDNLILRLSGVFNNLDKSMAVFKSSSEEFIAKLNDFNSRGGIKGPNIPQEVAIKVSFDEDLTVVAQNNNNQALLDNISSLVSDTVTRQLNQLRIFG